MTTRYPIKGKVRPTYEESLQQRNRDEIESILKRELDELELQTVEYAVKLWDDWTIICEDIYDVIWNLDLDLFHGDVFNPIIEPYAKSALKKLSSLR